MTGKPAWSLVKLRVLWGDVPECGDGLVTRTSRRYQVIGVRGRALTCLVIPPSEPPNPDGRTLQWTWGPRRTEWSR